jgi:flagellar biosynthetic protein FlhB
MANQDSAQKTEQPTPRRLQEARRKGQVAKSSDLNGSIILLAIVVYIYAVKDSLVSGIQDYFYSYLNNCFHGQFLENNTAALYYSSRFFLGLLGPLFAFVVAIAVLANIVQVGFFYAHEALQFKFERINPANGLKNVFSKKALLELLKSLLKITIIAVVAVLLIKGRLPDVLEAGQGTPARSLNDAAQIIIFIAGCCGLVYLVLAILDYLHRWYQHKRELMMSKEELKKEFKEAEGDPQLKSRLRERQRQVSMNRLLSEMPKATVVITNPVHLAVALRYEQESMDVPRIVAKGAGRLAERIKELAAKYDVPVIENKDLARLLYRTTEAGDEIPIEVYQAVAEIIALIYKIRK